MSRITGSKYEAIALAYLEKEGLVLYKKNYSALYGEIDLIMQDGDTIIFVEVRMRQKMDDALESVTPAKIQKLVNTMSIFLVEEKRTTFDCRFDVITIDGNNAIQWTKDIELI